MNVKGINNNQNVFAVNNKQTLQRKYKEEQNTELTQNVKSDTLELSGEAKKLQPIMSRISSGFYNNPEILMSTAAKISKEF